MTVQNIIEIVQESFPNIGRTRIIKEIDRIQKDFQNKTHSLEKRASLSSPSSNVAWDLPSDFLSLKDINFYDSSNNPLYLDDDIYVKSEIELGKIFFYGTNSTDITTLPSSIDDAQLIYYYRPTDVDEIGDTLTVDEEYHDAILAGVMERLFVTIPTVRLNEAGGMGINTVSLDYWNGSYNKYVREARRKAKSKDDRPIEVYNYQFAGAFNSKKRVKTSSSSSTIDALVGYSKYYRIKVTPPTTVTVEQSAIGFTGTVSASVSGDILSIQSTSNEFDDNYQVVGNAIRTRKARSGSYYYDVWLNPNWENDYSSLVFEVYKR